MKIEIVKFKNGKYAIRKKNWFGFGFRYRTKYNGYWFGLDDAKEYCQGSLEEMKEIYNNPDDYGIPIKLTNKKI